MTYENSINNTFVSSFSKSITFIKGKDPFMLEDKSNNVQKRKLKGKFIPTCQHCEIEEHVKRNCFVSKNQNLEYKIDLVLNQLCTIERKIDKLVGYEKSNEIESSNRTKMKN
jgi:hypothetical protein